MYSNTVQNGSTELEAFNNNMPQCTDNEKFLDHMTLSVFKSGIFISCLKLGALFMENGRRHMVKIICQEKKEDFTITFPVYLDDLPSAPGANSRHLIFLGL